MTDINLMEGELSLYEDALDDSDEELQKLHYATAIQLEKVERQSRRRQILPIITTAPNISSTIIPPQSSSSEHSSIEKLTGEPVRSRRSTGMLKKRSHKSGTSSASNGGGGTPDEWKFVNNAFQEAASYPILFQLNQQLQTISVQLNELSCANALQLKTTYRLLRETVKVSHLFYVNQKLNVI
uniref:Uncharacterized protein n=1 Tax=Panagrolaimus sp. PS1159 TaxID=55785 RepID=A0AC35EUN1_9BILA